MTARRSFVALAFIAVNLMACCCGGGVPVNNTPANPQADFDIPPAPLGGDEFKARYGEPDHTVAHALTGGVEIWRKERVQIVYLPTQGRLKFDRFQDPNTKEELDNREVRIRMYDRDSFVAAKKAEIKAAAKAEQDKKVVETPPVVEEPKAEAVKKKPPPFRPKSEFVKPR